MPPCEIVHPVPEPACWEQGAVDYNRPEPPGAYLFAGAYEELAATGR